MLLARVAPPSGEVQTLEEAEGDSSAFAHDQARLERCLATNRLLLGLPTSSARARERAPSHFVVQLTMQIVTCPHRNLVAEWGAYGVYVQYFCAAKRCFFYFPRSQFSALRRLGGEGRNDNGLGLTTEHGFQSTR